MGNACSEKAPQGLAQATTTAKTHRGTQKTQLVGSSSNPIYWQNESQVNNDCLLGDWTTGEEEFGNQGLTKSKLHKLLPQN